MASTHINHQLSCVFTSTGTSHCVDVTDVGHNDVSNYGWALSGFWADKVHMANQFYYSDYIKVYDIIQLYWWLGWCWRCRAIMHGRNPLFREESIGKATVVSSGGGIVPVTTQWVGFPSIVRVWPSGTSASHHKHLDISGPHHSIAHSSTAREHQVPPLELL